MERCPWESEDDSGDDEWFYGSLTRYEHLLMYGLSVSAQCISISQDGQFICIGGTRNVNSSMRNKKGENEMLVYSVPAKLNTSCPQKEGLSSNRDFKLRAGAFTDSAVTQASFYGVTNEKLLSTSSGEKGVKLWNILPDEDLITSVAWLFSSSIISPAYCVAGGKFYLAGNSVIEQANVETWTVDKSIAIGGIQSQKVLSLYCDDRQNVWWCDGAGRVGAENFMSRNKPFSDINLTSYQDVNTQNWSFAFLPSSSIMVAAVGSHGKLCILDTRSTKKLFLSENLTFDSSMPLTPPSIYGSFIRDEIAVNSADVVNVYDFNGGKLNLLFEHDGHKKRKGVDVLCTVWHSAIDNLLFSADSQQNLHAWSFPKAR